MKIIIILLTLALLSGIALFAYIEYDKPNTREIEIKMEYGLTAMGWNEVHVNMKADRKVISVLAFRMFDGKRVIFFYTDRQGSITVDVIDAALNSICSFIYPKDKEESVELQNGINNDVERFRPTAEEFKANCYDEYNKAKSSFRKFFLKM